MIKIIFIILNLLFSCSYFALNKLQDVRFWNQPDGIRIVLDLDNQADFSYLILKNPSRLVVDISNISLINKSQKKDIDNIPSIYNLLKKTRYGYSKNKDRLRLVFDIEQNTQNLDYRIFKLTPNSIYPHRLVIDLSIKESKKQSYIPIRNNKFIVAIDAGHGGEDPGAIGPRGTYEKHVTYNIAKYLYNDLKKYKDIEPILIRKGDYYVGLRKRIKIARENNANLFVSIHADGFTDRRVHGASVFTLSDKGATSEMARWLANNENDADLLGGVSLDDKDDMLAHVLLDLSQTATKKYSINLANTVLANLNNITTLHKRHVEQAGFLVLKSPDIPSVLIETGFISNYNGEQKLRSTNFQREMAKNIASSIYKYYTKYEKYNLNPNKLDDIIQASSSKLSKKKA